MHVASKMEGVRNEVIELAQAAPTANDLMQ
jgi:hypothetical protein